MDDQSAFCLPRQESDFVGISWHIFDRVGHNFFALGVETTIILRMTEVKLLFFRVSLSSVELSLKCVNFRRLSLLGRAIVKLYGNR